VNQRIDALAVHRTADGGLRPDPTTWCRRAHLDRAQVITYTLNRGHWSDGVPITWRDFEASGRPATLNPAFKWPVRRLPGHRLGHQGSETAGRGHLARPFAEWPSLFSLLYPAATNADPAVFNTAG